MPEYAYVGREACGCVTLLTVDSEQNRREAAREVARHIKRGGTVERMTVEDARTSAPFGCEHSRKNNTAAAS